MLKVLQRPAAWLAPLFRKLNEPLLLATLAGIAGILLADWGVYATISAVAAVALGIGFAAQTNNRTFLLLAVAGLFAFTHNTKQETAHALPFAEEILAGGELLVETEGVVDSHPKVSATGRTSFFLTLTKLRKIGGDEILATQRVYVSTKADPPPRYGELLRVRGSLKTPALPRNPGEFDFRAFLERKGVIAQLSTRKDGDLEVLGSGHGNPIIVASTAAREWVAGIITEDIARRDPDITGVLTAMSLGDRSDTPDEIIESFRTSGTLHIFAVSGLHVGLILAFLLVLLAPLPLNRRYIALTIIVILCCYAFITGLRPSAVRATIMACLVLSAPLFDREPRLINSLGAAGFAILLLDSNQLFLPGFQLSFAVLLALTLFHKPFYNLFMLIPCMTPDEFLPNSLLTDFQRNYYRVLKKIAQTIAVSIAAWLGSLPLMVIHFHLVTPIAPIANFFLIPVAFFVLCTAILSLLFGAVGASVFSVLLNNSNYVFASLLAAAAMFFSNLPVPVSHFYVRTSPQPDCEIVVMDIPRGGAANVISTNTGEDWLLDTGNSRDLGSITSTLHEHAGAARIDGMVLTHTDAAHIGAALEIIDAFYPDKIYPPRPNRSSSTYRKLAAKLESSSAEVLTPTQDSTIRIDKDTTLRTLYAYGEGKPRLSDDACFVFLLESQGWRILFTGDAGFATERALLEARPQELRADVIVRGNHSSDHSLTAEFIDAVDPAAVVVNVRNFEDESPDDSVWREALAKRGVAVFHQSETGAVTLSLEDDALQMKSFLTDQTLTVSREQ